MSDGDLRLDGFDLKILNVLQAEGRLPMVELADRIGLSATPTQRRVQRLEAAGIIAGYGARLDRRRAGLSLTVFLHLKIEGHHERNASLLQKRLVALPEVVACHIVSGDADLIAEVVVRDLGAYEAFMMDKLLKLPMIKEMRSLISLRALKVGGPLEVALEERQR
jgi:Lrp/AsnC family transcriptional regulator, leucine-responsive regulatory protein